MERRPERHQPEPSAPISAPATAATVAAGVIAEAVVPDRAVREAPAAPSSFEAERVREFEPRETAPVEPVLAGPGFAPAEPVKIEWPSDLKQVESDPDKVRSAEQEEVVQQALPRPRRVRQPAQPVIEEPLVQIETGEAGGASGSSDPKEKETSLPG
jgi:ribonuclease E